MLGKLLQQLTHKKILICSFLSANAKRFEMAKEMERQGGKPLCPQPQRWQQTFHFSCVALWQQISAGTFLFF